MIRHYLLANLLAIVVVLFSGVHCDAQGRIFWSNRGLGEGALPGDEIVYLGIGQPTEVFCYYQTLGQDVSDGFVLDLSFNHPEAVVFSSASTSNFDVTVAGTPIGMRWDLFGDADVSDHAITNFAATNLGGQYGLLESNNGSGAFVDHGYDPGADAFLLGSMVITMLGIEADLELTYDLVQVVDDGQPTEPILDRLILQHTGCVLTARNDLWQHSDVIAATEFPVLMNSGNLFSFTEPGEQQVEETGSTVWYHLTAPADGLMSVDVLATMDTQLHIYTGAELGFENLIPVADNNDSDGGLQSRVSFPVSGGQRYEIRVGGYLYPFSYDYKNTDGDEGCFGLVVDFLKNALPGDVNCDGSVNLLDVVPFVETIVGGSYDPKADVNFDGDVNLLDVDTFVVLIGG